MTSVVALRDTARDGVALRQASNLADWAAQAREAAQVAVSLAKTPFVPASLRDRDPGVTAANITAAILTGMELGIEPMAALRSIDVIQGTPALRAIALRAVVLAAGHEIWLHESTNTRAIVRGRRRGSDQMQESAWTMDRAKALSLAGKDNWRKQPGAMLVARATSECARLIAADALLGVPYSVEELEDAGEMQPPAPDAATTRTAPTVRTARRRTAQQTPAARPAVEAQDPDPDPDPEPEPEPEPGFDDDPPAAADDDTIMITDAQMKKMQAGFRDLGVTDRDDRIGFTAEFLGRGITSAKDLSKDEASALIDDLERRAATRDEHPDDEETDTP